MLHDAQRVGVAAGTVGTPCEDVDRATRAVIDDAGYGDYFIHRTGHGIGMEEHEDPYIVEGNTCALAPDTRTASSPGSTSRASGACGSKTSSWPPQGGPVALNNSDHDLVSVDA